MLSREENISRRIVVEGLREPHGLLSPSFIKLHEKYYGKEVAFRLFCLAVATSAAVSPFSACVVGRGVAAITPSTRLSRDGGSSWFDWCFSRPGIHRVHNMCGGLIPHGRNYDDFWVPASRLLEGYQLHSVYVDENRNRIDMRPTIEVGIRERHVNNSSASSDLGEGINNWSNLYGAALAPFCEKSYITRGVHVSFLRGLYGLTSAGICSRSVFSGDLSVSDFVDHVHTIAAAAVISQEGPEAGGNYVGGLSDRLGEIKSFCSNRDNWRVAMI